MDAVASLPLLNRNSPFSSLLEACSPFITITHTAIPRGSRMWPKCQRKHLTEKTTLTAGYTSSGINISIYKAPTVITCSPSTTAGWMEPIYWQWVLNEWNVCSLHLQGSLPRVVLYSGTFPSTVVTPDPQGNGIHPEFAEVWISGCGTCCKGSRARTVHIGVFPLSSAPPLIFPLPSLILSAKSDWQLWSHRAKSAEQTHTHIHKHIQQSRAHRLK